MSYFCGYNSITFCLLQRLSHSAFRSFLSPLEGDLNIKIMENISSSFNLKIQPVKFYLNINFKTLVKNIRWWLCGFSALRRPLSLNNYVSSATTPNLSSCYSASIQALLYTRTRMAFHTCSYVGGCITRYPEVLKPYHFEKETHRNVAIGSANCSLIYLYYSF